MRTTIGLALLGFQVFMIGYARFVPSRYFCWAPYDIQTEYRLDVTVNGRRLTAKEESDAAMRDGVHVNFEQKWAGPDGVVIDVSHTGWEGTD